VQLVLTDVHHPAGARELAAFERGGHALVRGARQGHEDEERHDPQRTATDIG
jgi:hypothetical protein